MKKHIFITLLFLGSFAGQAQLFCSAQVLDSLTNSPLEGATVLLNHEGRNLGARTDKEGKFRIELPYVDNVIQIRYTGYVSEWVYLKAGNSMIDGTVQGLVSPVYHCMGIDST